MREAGPHGVSSERLNRIAFRYSAVIFTLRKQGHSIVTVSRYGTKLALFVLYE